MKPQLFLRVFNSNRLKAGIFTGNKIIPYKQYLKTKFIGLCERTTYALHQDETQQAASLQGFMFSRGIRNPGINAANLPGRCVIIVLNLSHFLLYYIKYY
jgi:hypothetical protein